MKDRSLYTWTRRMAALTLCMLMLGGGIGCEKSAREHLNVANAALIQEDADRAEEALKQARQNDLTEKEKVEADIFQAQVHQLRGQYEKAEEVYNSIVEEQKLDADELNKDQKVYKRLLDDRFPELYRLWADSINPKDNPQKYEEVLQKGLKFDESSTPLNTLLVDFYEGYADRLIEQGKKAEAAEQLRKIYSLRTTPKRREAAQDRANKLELEVFINAAQERFTSELKPKLVEAERWDEENKLVLFEAEGTYDRGLSDEQANKFAVLNLSKVINQFIRELTDLDEDVNLGVSATLSSLKIMEQQVRRGRFEMRAGLPVDPMIAYAYQAKKAAEKKAKEEEKDGEAGDAEDKEGEGASEDAEDGADQEDAEAKEDGGDGDEGGAEDGEE